MFQILLFEGYSRKTPKYVRKRVLSDLTHTMSIADHIAIIVETLKIYNRFSLEKDFVK